jgi:MYXO-CTERM domain-containing protein
MKIAVLSVLALAGAASANITVSAEPLDAPGFESRVGEVYSNILGPFSGFPARAGSLGFDDYSSTMANPVESMTIMKFVGGVTVANTLLNVNFYNTSAVLVNSFSITLPQGGNFIWTITMGGGGLDIPKDGIVELVAPQGSTGRWFLTPTAPSIGSTSQTFGGATNSAGAHLNHAFEIVTPAPGAAALLGLGGLVATRRRRA